MSYGRRRLHSRKLRREKSKTVVAAALVLEGGRSQKHGLAAVAVAAAVTDLSAAVGSAAVVCGSS
jgi:hypothetical protein